MARKIRRLFAFWLAVIGFSKARFVSASDNPLNILFNPFERLSIGSAYDLYHYWVDFSIFLLIFVSLARLTLGRRFSGREGRVISTVVGVALALSLTLLEYRLGFDIRSFGPIAGGILVFIMGLVIFQLIKAVGAGSASSGSFAFVITYILLRATLPEVFAWAEDNSWFAWLHLGLAIAMVVSVVRISRTLFSGTNVRVMSRSMERSMKGNNDQDSGLRREVDDQRQEVSLVKKELRQITGESVKQGVGIIDALRDMVKVIEKYGSSDKARRLIAERINKVAPRETAIQKELAYLRELLGRIEGVDLRFFKELRDRWGKVPQRQRDILKEEILLEKEKIISEEKLRQMEAMVSKCDKEFRYCLSGAVASLQSNQAGQARDWLLKAIKCEEEGMAVLKEMKEIEQRLLKLTKKEYKTLKKEWKDEKG